MTTWKKPQTVPGVITTRVLTSWRDALALRDEYGMAHDRWVFRGLPNAGWTIKSTFERAREGGGTSPAWKYEAVLLREFSRRAHHYRTDLPGAQNVLEWFALMRYYGAPSRIVDFSYSFYVAAYFALHDSSPETGPAAVWAINTSWLREVYDRAFPKASLRRGKNFRFKDPKDFRRTFLSRTAPRQFVAPANPFRMNERLSAQQGVFLCPGDIQKSFMSNLLPRPLPKKRDRVVRIVLAPEVKTEAIRDLRRMNVTAATLYPDLGGFAQSLKDWFHLPLYFDPKDLAMALDGHFPGDHF
jgi:hypothetical protein